VIIKSLLRVENCGAVAVIDIDNPPVNALAHDVRAALIKALDAIESDDTVAAVVVHGCGRHFVAGADVREFDRDPVEPLLNDVLLRLESLSKPVVAALHGTVFGGGAELALACHYRGASRDLQFGFPEIRLGLIPGSGGCVRFPRLVGMQAAIDAILGGRVIDYSKAEKLDIIDRELGADPRADAVAYAEELLVQKPPTRRLRDLASPAADSHQLLDAARDNLPREARHVPAGLAAVEALRATIDYPFERALTTSRSLFEQCRRSGESRALRHLFFAERPRSSVASEPRAVSKVGVVGAGTMGSGIAIALASAGYGVKIIDTNASAALKAIERVQAALQENVRKNRMTPDAMHAALERLESETDLGALVDSDLVVEAAFERIEVKDEIFAKLGRVLPPGVILATNTSALDVDQIAAASGRAQDVVGMHFFSPANVMRLVEIVRGAQTDDRALATAVAVTTRMGKIGIEVGNGFGFVGNRMLYAYGREKELLMLEGATPSEVDQALQHFGMAMGPNAVGDLAGLDVGYHARRAWVDRPTDPRYYRVSDLLVEQGRLGRKSGQGFYRYDTGGRRVDDPEVVDMIRAESKCLGVQVRSIDPAEIVERCMLALINEGARVIDEQIARSPDDVDAIWCNGYGFPRHRGGPMFHSRELGASHVVARLRILEKQTGEAWWRPADGLVHATNAEVASCSRVYSRMTGAIQNCDRSEPK
jgi:3-hydroxyacyl-CoA dehydrogenase